MNTESPKQDPIRQTENNAPGSSHSKRSSGIIIAVLGVTSFAIGFLLVHFTLPETSAQTAENSECTGLAPSTAPADNIPPEAPIEPAPDYEEQNETNSGGLPEVPPAPTPDGVRIDGAPLYFKCWADENDSSGSKECDRLRILEKRMATRLYVVHECKMKHGSDKDFGIVSLGANLDFGDNTIKFWSGPSSTLPNASKVGNCVRQKLAGLPLYSIDHKHKKYRVFFTVDFFDPKQRERQLAQKRKKGRPVKVVKDKVNVRETPVDGASLGRISSDSSVTLLKKNETGEWCMVLTPNNREGWMICNALGL